MFTKKKAGTSMYTAAYNLKKVYAIDRNFSNTERLITNGKKACIIPKRKNRSARNKG